MTVDKDLKSNNNSKVKENKMITIPYYTELEPRGFEEDNKKTLNGHSIAGMSVVRDRVDNDFYATPQGSVNALLKVENIVYPAWECACGDGAISKLLDGEVYSSDLIDRGYGEIGDFLKDYDHQQFNTIITNPPFNLFQEFAEHALMMTNDKVILFGKLQALEGQKRATFMQNSPLRTVYIFKSRQNPLRNGSPVDEKGKPWASTMAFAWFVWEKKYQGKPTIEWI